MLTLFCIFSLFSLLSFGVVGVRSDGRDTNGLGANGLQGDLLSEYSSTTDTPWRNNDVLYVHGILHYPNGGVLNQLQGVDAIYPSQAYETAIGEYLNLAPGHVKITAQVRPMAEFIWMGGLHGGATFAAVNQMYLAYLGSANAQPEEGVEPGVYVNFIISTNTSRMDDLHYIRQTAYELFHLDFTDQTILDQYSVPWVLRKINTQLGMWSQQVGYCETRQAVGEEAPSNPKNLQTWIADYANPNPLIPIQAEASTELIFDPTCIPTSIPQNPYGYGFGYSFSIVAGFCLIAYLVALDTKIKKAAIEKQKPTNPS